MRKNLFVISHLSNEQFIYEAVGSALKAIIEKRKVEKEIEKEIETLMGDYRNLKEKIFEVVAPAVEAVFQMLEIKPVKLEKLTPEERRLKKKIAECVVEAVLNRPNFVKINRVKSMIFNLVFKNLYAELQNHNILSSLLDLASNALGPVSGFIKLASMGGEVAATLNSTYKFSSRYSTLVIESILATAFTVIAFENLAKQVKKSLQRKFNSMARKTVSQSVAKALAHGIAKHYTISKFLPQLTDKLVKSPVVTKLTSAFIAEVRYLFTRKGLRATLQRMATRLFARSTSKQLTRFIPLIGTAVKWGLSSKMNESFAREIAEKITSLFDSASQIFVDITKDLV